MLFDLKYVLRKDLSIGLISIGKSRKIRIFAYL